MTTGWTALSGNGSISRFSRSLRLALHDRNCELSGPVLFCYDTNIALKMVLGFEDKRGNDDSRALLVCSLLSSGYLGPVTLLRPHALELHQFLARKESFHSAEARGASPTRLTQFLRSQKVTEVFAELVNDTIRKTDGDRVEN